MQGIALSKIEADEKIKRQADFLQVLIDAMPYPVFYKDRQGRYLGCNRSFERFYGISRERIAGKTVYEIAPKDLADVYRRTDDELWANPGMQTYEGCIQSVDGERHDVIFHKATFAGPDGSIAGLIGAAVDITERKRAENERAANLRFFESMDRVNRAMQGASDLEHAMSEVLEEMLSIFDCDPRMAVVSVRPGSFFVASADGARAAGISGRSCIRGRDSHGPRGFPSFADGFGRRGARDIWSGMRSATFGRSDGTVPP